LNLASRTPSRWRTRLRKHARWLVPLTCLVGLGPLVHAAIALGTSIPAPAVVLPGPSSTRAWVQDRAGITRVYLQGSPEGIGAAHGRLLRDRMLSEERELWFQYEEHVPWWIARVGIEDYSRLRFRHVDRGVPEPRRRELAAEASAFQPDPFAARMATYQRMMFLYALYDIALPLEHSPLIGCTSFAFDEGATADGHVLLARAFDFEAGDLLDRDKAVFLVREDGAIPFASVAWPGFVGAVTGMNAEGVVVVVHGALASESSGVRLALLVTNLPVLAASLGKVVFPFAPTALAVAADVSAWPGVLAAGGLIAGALLVPGVRGRVVCFGIAAFVALLAPVLAAPGTLLLDNRLYLPACGVLVALAELARAAAFAREKPVEPRLFVALSLVLVGVLAAVTAGYEGAFQDRRTFAREAVAGSPHSPLAHFCLGQSYQLDGDAEPAFAEYQASLALGPGEVVHNNLAVLYMAVARWADAERELRAELAMNPRYAKAFANLAIVLRREGRADEAREASEAARELEEP